MVNSNFLYRERNWLTEQYWGFDLTTRKLAKLCRCCDTTVINWMKKYDIPLRKIGKQPFDENKRRINRLWGMYKRICNRSDKTLNITYETFKKIITQPCYYCGDTPINGIDRLDNSKGYTLDNCVPCCFTCNWMKHKKNVIDFIYQIYKIQNHCSEKYGITHSKNDIGVGT